MRKKLGAGMLCAVLLLLAGCNWRLGPSGVPEMWQPQPLSGATPQAVYDGIWRDFDVNYPLFAAKGVNWNALRAQYRPHNPATDEVLWRQLTGLLGHLNDDHVMLEAPGFGRFAAGSLAHAPRDDFRPDLIRTRYLQQARTAGEGRITYGLLPGGLGYVHVRNFTGTTQAGAWCHDFDGVLQALRDTPGLVFDVRGNPGGNHRVARFMAERFTQRRRHYMNIQEKNGPGHGDFARAERWVLHPDAPFTYTRPVAVLTHGRTNSAAEVFVLAMRQIPQAVQVGGATAGNLGDLGAWRALPNGWRYVMPVNRITDPDGRGYDGTGIPPEVPALNSPAELEAGRDRVLDAASALLLQRSR